MRCPALAELPAPEPGLTGWPWTEETPRLGATMPDGRPWPRVTVVTPSLNQARFLEETIRSVLLQGYPDLEYVVVDGGSNDGSREIIGKYERFFAWWASEADRGQADAIDKGLAQATGEIFNWVNSDDVLQPGALATVAQAMRGDIDAFGGRGLVVEGVGESVPRRCRRIAAKNIIRGDLGVRCSNPRSGCAGRMCSDVVGLTPRFTTTSTSRCTSDTSRCSPASATAPPSWQRSGCTRPRRR